MKNQGGFSLIELVIVIVIMGILGTVGSTFFGGATESAKAEAKMQLANSAANKATAVFSLLGTGTIVPSNSIVHANNSLEDVLFANTGVSATYSTRFDATGITSLRNSLAVTTEPVNGTSEGAYEMPDTGSVVTIVAGGTRQIGFRFTNTTGEEVAALVAKYEPATTYAASTADTSGTIQYTADSSGTGLHTLTIVKDL